MIQRSDLEGKFREIQGTVDQTKQTAQDIGAMVAIGAVVLLVVVYLLGRRRGKKGSAQVEIYRLG